MTNTNPTPQTTGARTEVLSDLTSLTDDTASLEELIDDLATRLGSYLVDVDHSDPLPFWLYRQTWKRDGDRIPATEYPIEFLQWLTANTLAKIELAEPGEEPVNDLAIAQMAQLLIAALSDSDELDDQLAQTAPGDLLAGYSGLSLVIAAHASALGTDSAKSLGAASR